MKTKIFKSVFAIALAALVFSSQTSFAGGDATGRLSIGANVGLPTGDDAKVYTLAIGGSARYELPVGDNLGITGTVGYNSYLLKSEFSGLGISLSSIPILAGAKYYFTENQNGLYGMVQIGITMTTAKVEFLGASVSASTSNLTYGPAVGYHMTNLDFGVGYDILSQTGASSAIIDLRLAYVLGGK